MPCCISSSAARYAASVPTAVSGKKALGSVNPSATLPIACKGPCPAKGVPNILLAPSVNEAAGLVKDGAFAKKLVDAVALLVAASASC